MPNWECGGREEKRFVEQTRFQSYGLWHFIECGPGCQIIRRMTPMANIAIAEIHLMYCFGIFGDWAKTKSRSTAASGRTKMVL